MQEGASAMTMVDPKEYLDRRYEDTEASELPDAPADALRGLGKAGSDALRKAIGVKSIRDLATNQFVLAAQEILQLAEGGSALAVGVARMEGGAVADVDRAQGRSDDDDDDKETLTRSEEELEVGTEKTRRGRAGVRKRVKTEQVERTVPVQREELRVEREPITAEERGDAEIAEDEHTVELHEERPVVEKQVVPKERVRVGKEVVTDEEQVSEELRKEELAVDDPDRRR
jgi:uncharacterized protein (TIGR02271 family)